MSTHDLQPEIQDAVEELRKQFAKQTATYRHVVRTLYYDRIHETRSDDYEDCRNKFDEWWSLYPEIRTCFSRLTGKDAPAAVSRAFFDFYVEMSATRSKFLLVEGTLQNRDNVIHVRATRLKELSSYALELQSHDFH